MEFSKISPIFWSNKIETETKRAKDKVNESIQAIQVPGGIPVYPDKAPVYLPTPPIDPESVKLKTVISQERQKKISTVKKLTRKIRKRLKSLKAKSKIYTENFIQRIIPSKMSKNLRKSEICIIKADVENPSFHWGGANLHAKTSFSQLDSKITVTAEELKKAKMKLKVSTKIQEKPELVTTSTKETENFENFTLPESPPKIFENIPDDGFLPRDSGSQKNLIPPPPLQWDEISDTDTFDSISDFESENIYDEVYEFADLRNPNSTIWRSLGQI